MKIYTSSEKWEQTEQAYSTGFLFHENKLYEGRDLLTLIGGIETPVQLEALLKASDGQFAFILNKPGMEAAAIDGTRLFPLFYAFCKDEFCIGDNPEMLPCTTLSIDPIAEREYNASGAVFSGKTIMKEIREVKPYHYLLFQNGQITQKSYYQFTVRQNEIRQHNAAEFDACLSRVFDRTLATLHGRQIVIPLSGGLDSRLIACMLKKKGVKDVVCYTVCKNDDVEVQRARKVAEALDYPFIQVNPNKDGVVPADYLQREEFNQFYHYVGSYTSFVFLYDYFVVRYLRSNHLIADDAVFMPGHTGDMVAGGYLKDVLMQKHASISFMASALAYENFEYGYDDDVYQELKQILSDSLQQNLPFSVYNNFIQQNRLTHQINNSARIYQFFGHEVRLPFWDRELLEMFRTLKFSEQWGERFYFRCLKQGLYKEFGVNFEGEKAALSVWTFLKQIIKNRIKRYLPLEVIHRHGHFEDIVGEKEMSVPMLQELISSGYYQDDQHYLCNNQILKDWYLMRVKKEIENELISC